MALSETVSERIHGIHNCRIAQYRGYHRIQGQWVYPEFIGEGHSASYGDFDNHGEPADSWYLLHENLSGSDYSGSLVNRANFKDFLELFGESPGVHEVYGGHGTFAVAVRLDCLTDEMAEVLAGLSDYPLISDETHSRLEMEGADEAWSSWAESDFRCALKKNFDCEIDGEIDRAWFEARREEANEYWQNEGDSQDMWIRLERIVEGVTLDDLLAHPRENFAITFENEAEQAMWIDRCIETAS